MLLLATAATRVVEAKASVSQNDVFSNTYRAAERYLQDDGKSAVEAFLSVKDEADSSGNSRDYTPHSSGTAVRFEDQDGTWMDGTIDKYDSETKTYTIKWDEDNVREDFSDLGKVDQLVANAEKKNDDDDEGDENYDWDSDEEIGDAPESDEAPYRGSVPDEFDFGYTYKYEDLSKYEPWPVGTLTLLEFADGWYEGNITSFSLSDDKANVTYIVTWSDGTTDVFVNELEWMDLMVANAQDYEPWSIGTSVYGYPNPNTKDTESKYLDGKITAFENGAYTIKWSNDDVKVYSDFDVVDELVNSAGMHFDPNELDHYEPWPYNTPVSWDFDDGWWNGTITGFSGGSYEITWSDGTSKIYSSLDKIDQMVAFAAGEGFISDDDRQYDDYQSGDDYYAANDYYPVGTLAYAQFQDGWWVGYVDSYENDYYVVLWSDGSSDDFLPGPDMDEMVNNAQYISNDFDLYPEGTRVYSKFNGNWYWGTVEHSASGFYEILWEDGERTVHVAGDAIDEMVANAYSTTSGSSAFGVGVLSMLVLGGIAGITFFVVRGNMRKKQSSEVTEQVQENELALTEAVVSTIEYSDHPLGETQPGVV